jgi:tetratricopeptide (TPR) repeat protein
MNYKKEKKNAAQIGKELRAGTLLEGSVRKAGSKIRVSAQLIDSNTEGHLWAENYDRDLEDVFAVQSAIAENVAGALKLKLLETETERIERKGPSNPEAYVEYLTAIHFLAKFDEEGFRKAIRHLEKALVLEPDYVPALAKMSSCYLDLGYFGYEPSNQAYPIAKEFASRALRLDETIPEAHLSMGFVQFFYEWNWARAEMEYKRAIELNPNLADAHWNYALYLSNFGRTDEAVSEIRKVLELDPISLISQLMAGNIYGLAGMSPEALAHFEKALEMNPDSAITHSDLGLHLIYIGRIEDGVKELEKALSLSGDSVFFKGNLGWAYGISGRRGEALKLAEEIRAASKTMPVASYVASVYAGLGEKGEALDWLEKAYQDHSIIYNPLFTVDQAFANLHEEPRFRELIRKLGLDSYRVTLS